MQGTTKHTLIDLIVLQIQSYNIIDFRHQRV